MGKYIIAGASSGIGKELAKNLLGRGCEVIAMNRSVPDFTHPNLYHVAHDFSGEASLPQIDGEFAGLVYCPGSINLRPINTLKSEQVIDDFKLNAVGAFSFAKAYRSNLAAGAGIVFFSSVAAKTGMPFHASIAMSKGAVEGLTVALAAEFAPTIRVNCIAPSLTDTPLASPLLNTESKQAANADRHPLKRIGTPEDLASMAVFLLTEANWMTGQIVSVNGGLGTILK
ncbi:SDR family oxidoreductase [Flavobacterium sp. MAH-1]|uniref:SDR family oxidoreductase n=1 Tax=Flavobacterium agri TaxID=2743471 RepID=A0A7Y9C702_9FLAO|nr:SDR family oxidoreductase [Flavobacterium agri]NYA71959.1 SDR family oxidoreductase [Flavobacterium agri]